MTMKRVRFALLLLASLLIVVACGEKPAAGPASPGLTRACNAICTKRGECDAHFDAEACKTRCTTLEVVRKVESFRAEATDQILGCLTANACDADLGATTRKCAIDAAGKTPPSARARALCAKLEPSFADCGFTWAIPCNVELNLFAEKDLGVFDECVDRSCRGGVHCFAAAEGTLTSRHH